MPFIGRDWRDNGELWRKTDLGSWQHTRSVPYASLSDVFIALDMINSVHDHRRFHYITKVSNTRQNYIDTFCLSFFF